MMTQAASIIQDAQNAEAQGPVKADVRRMLLKKYIDREFAQMDLIMCSTKLTTSVLAAIGDVFSFGAATPSVKSAEALAMRIARSTRKAQAQRMYAHIEALPPYSLQLITAGALAKNGGPSFEWLMNRLDSEASSVCTPAAAGGAVAAAAAASVAATAASIAGEVFVDYATTALFDVAMSCAPLGIGAGISAAANAKRIAAIEGRIRFLNGQIDNTKPHAA